MTTLTRRQPVGLLGAPVDRVDGPLKVTGSAPYPSDVEMPGQAYGALVESTIAAGRVTRIETEAAARAPGVLAVITHANAMPVTIPTKTPLGVARRYPFADDRILHHGQHVAIVVATTPAQARAAAGLVEVEYEKGEPVLGIDNPDAPVEENPFGWDVSRGDVGVGFAEADEVLDESYAIAAETNNPMGLFATVAGWDGDHLVVHETTQWPTLARTILAGMFGVPDENVRVLIPYLGGGFGAGLLLPPHAYLTVLAARMVDRPVKLVLTRPQMFTGTTYRSRTLQHLRIGMTRDGRLTAIDHRGTGTIGMEEGNIEPVTGASVRSYDCPHLATHDRQVRLNVPNPGAMRAPGTVQGNFALESALDELAHRLDIDPVDLRLTNFAEVEPTTGRRWSSNALHECYEVAADRFGWWNRDPRVRSMRDGDELIGYGMAGATYEWYVTPCTVAITVSRDGTAVLRTSATDLGTGTYTIATQLTAELLGLDLDRVRVEIGDSALPPAPQSGGSGLATSLTAAVDACVREVVAAFMLLVLDDERSPLRGRTADEVEVHDGRIHLADAPSVGESYGEILARHDLPELRIETSTAPRPDQGDLAPSGAFGARFAEVRVDEDLGTVRVARLVSAIDGGRVLNEKTARSQVLGATVMGIGMALLEDTVFDDETGRIVNATFSDYLVPVNADVPDLDVVFVGDPDRFNPVGVKGIGEVGIVGVAPAIANAVFHATGRRVRSLPITIDQMIREG